MKYLLSILKRTSVGRIQYYRSLSSSSVNNYNQLPTTCDTQSDVYKVFGIFLIIIERHRVFTATKLALDF